MTTANITLSRGDTYLNDLTITDQDGDVYDLTAASVWLTIKERSDRSDDDDDALIQLTVGSGITVADPDSGVASVAITDEQTATLTAGRTYRYDVQVRKAGQTFTPVTGTVVVSGDVTRA